MTGARFRPANPGSDPHPHAGAPCPRWRRTLGAAALAALVALIAATSALGAPVTLLDQGGPDDLANQKDLNALTIDVGTSPLAVGWQWDDTSSSGANTLDACALFDTDGDGNANAAVCVVAGGDSPSAVEQATVTYTCNDNNPDRCSGANVGQNLPPSDPMCSVGAATDPFHVGQQDRAANCLIPLNLGVFGGNPPTLLNVCSYPSQQPNSAPSDCVRTPGSVTFTKVVVNDHGGSATPGQFSLVLDPSGPGANVVIGHGQTIVVDNGAYTLSEQGPTAGYTATYACVRSLGGANVIGQGNTLTIAGSASVTCTVTNDDRAASATFTKTVVNNSGGTATAGQFSLVLDPTGPGANVVVGHGAPATSIAAGTYTVSETGPAAYDQTALSCGAALSGTTLTVALGAQITCTATNDDKPVDLSITKTNGVGVNTVTAGETTTYTIVVTNSGPHTITGASVVDNLPAEIVGATWTCTPSAGAGCTATSGNGNINTTVTLPPLGTATFLVTAPVAASATGTLSNTATVAPPAGVTDEINPDNNTATDTDTIVRSADLQVVKSGPGTYTPGGPISYTITVTNNGPSTANNVAVLDAIPAVVATSADQISCTPTPTLTASCGTESLTGNDLSYSGGALPVGGQLVITINGTVAADATVSPLENTASATATEDQGPNVSTASSVRVPDVDLVVEKTANPLVYTPGGPMTYTIVVRNTGLTTAQPVTVSDTVPATVTVTNVTCATTGTASCGTNASSGNTVSFTGVVLPRDNPATAAVENAITITITGTVSASSNQAIRNVARATTPDDPNGHEDDAISTLNPAVDIDIDKTDNSPTYTPGGAITYVITAVNQNVADAPNVTISDTLPGSILGATWTCAGVNGATCGTASGSGNISLTASIPGTIPNQPQPRITITVTGTVSPAAVGDLINTATATPVDVTDSNPANNSATDTDTQSSDVDLVVTKTDGSPTYTPGAPIAYTITVRNAGVSNATDVSISDPIPAAIGGATWTCTAAGGASCGTPTQGSGNVQITGAALPSGPGHTLTIVVRGTVDPGATGPLSNTVTATPSEGITDRNPADNTATDTDTAVIAADLKVTKTDGQPSYVPGTQVVYTITVTNAGPSNAVNATVSDPLPSAVTAATWSCVPDAGATCGSGTGSINDIVSIPVGKRVVYTLTATISSAATGDLVNTVTAGPAVNFGDVNPADNTATDTDTANPVADLAVTKTVDRPSADQGQNTVFAITVTNRGPSAATSVVATDTLPAGLTLVSITPSQGSCAQSGVCQLGTLATGASATIRVEVRLTGAGPVRNVVRVASAVSDPNAANNEAEAQVSILPRVAAAVSRARLAITKAGPARAKAGSLITYAIRVSVPRNSPATARSVVLRDVLPRGMSLAGQRALARAGKVRMQNGTVSVALGDIAPGRGRTVQLTVRIGKKATGRLVNVATAQATNAPQVRASAATRVSAIAAPVPAVTG